MAGREIRVMVMNDQIYDAQAIVMFSKEFARAIENEPDVPGPDQGDRDQGVSRATDYAR